MSATFSYALNSATWSLVGVIIGYLLGRLGRNVNEIKDDVSTIRETVLTEPPAEASGAHAAHRQVHWWIPTSTNDQARGLIVLAMVLATVSLIVYQKVQLERTTACYVRYAQQVTAAFAARDRDSQQARSAAIDNNTALGALVKEVITNAPANGTPPTPQQRQDSFIALSTYFTANQHYTASLTTAQQSARNFPFPTNDC